jgi:hypothetical protein
MGPPEHATQVSVEWLKPVFREGVEASVLTSNVVISGRVALADRLVAVGELPVVYARTKRDGVREEEFSTASTTLGNPYAGIELRGRSVPFILEMGTRLPLTPEGTVVLPSVVRSPPSAVGSLADLNRFSAYLGRLVPIQLVGNYHYRPDESVVSLRLRGGPELFIPTSEYAAGGIMLTYGAQEWYHGKRLDVGLGVTGRWIPQAHVGFRESSVHQATITVRGRFGGIQPGVLVRLPVDDSHRKRISVVVGASVTVPLLSSSES